MKNDIVRISHETQSMRDRIKDNKEKIKVNKTLPYLVSNVIEVRLSPRRSGERQRERHRD